MYRSFPFVDFVSQVFLAGQMDQELQQAWATLISRGKPRLLLELRLAVGSPGVKTDLGYLSRLSGAVVEQAQATQSPKIKPFIGLEL